MPKLKALALWDLTPNPKALDGLKQVANVTVRPATDKEYASKHLPEYDVYLPSLYVPLDKAQIEKATRLKLVGTNTTGQDHIDVAELKKRNIRFYSIKTEFGLLDSVTATAELAWGLLLASVRKMPAAHSAAMRGHWARDEYRGHQMSGKTLGILGVGRLGSMVADYGKAFRMRVLGCDPNPRKKVLGVEYVDLDTMLRESDVISVHIHLTEENRNFISAQEFAKMKPGVVIINTSRGGIIKEDDFLQALETGRVGGAGLDVIDGEWRTDLIDHQLIKYAREHDNVVIMPHLGGITYESQGASLEFTANKVADIVREMTK